MYCARDQRGSWSVLRIILQFVLGVKPVLQATVEVGACHQDDVPPTPMTLVSVEGLVSL